MIKNTDRYKRTDYGKENNIDNYFFIHLIKTPYPQSHPGDKDNPWSTASPCFPYVTLLISLQYKIPVSNYATRTALRRVWFL